MAFLARSAVAFVAACAVVLGSRAAGAQSVTPTQQPYPERFVNGVDVGQSTRDFNLNPFGINYSDCLSDMTLQFNLTLDGFTGSQNMQIWATASGDCTAPTTRGIGGVPTCWQLEGALTIPSIDIATTRSFNVRARDLVGPENTPPDPPVVVNEGASACNVQTTFAGVPITVWFLPLDLSGNMIGSPYSQTINTDLVGPPPPVGIAETVGDTLFTVTWTPNTDADTTGYDVFVDAPGLTDAGTGTDATLSANEVLYCPDAAAAASSGTASGASTGASSGTVVGSGTVATSGTVVSTSGTVATTGTSAFTPSVDAGCFYVFAGGTPPSSALSNAGSCESTHLSGGFMVTSGATVVDEAGDVSSGGGISTIDCAYVVGVGSNCYAEGGETVTGESTTQYTIRGLQDGTTYDVVVASVDGSGNVGPPSTCVHDFPAPVNDFWATYRSSGGRAGGSFCALEAVGLPVGSAALFGGLGAALLAGARRRGRKRS
jgi:hypothetical protein